MVARDYGGRCYLGGGCRGMPLHTVASDYPYRARNLFLRHVRYGSLEMFEFVLNVTMAGAGAALYILSKPLARRLNEWSAKQYERFPRLKLLPGSGNAGTALNYKITFIWFRICGAFVCLTTVLFLALLLSLRR